MRYAGMASHYQYSLLDLADSLRDVQHKRLMSQQHIAAALDIDQSTVSKAKTGTLTRRTKKTDQLMRFVTGLLNAPAIGHKVIQEVNKFYSNGGSEEDLIRVIGQFGEILARQTKA